MQLECGLHNVFAICVTMGSFICFYRIFRIFKKLEDPSSNFPNFRRAVFQFRISLAALSKKIFRCLYFLGKVRIAFAIELNSLIAMRTFPKNIKHLIIVVRTLISKIRNWKRAFRNFWKIGRRRFQISNIPIFGRNQINVE